MHVCLCHQIEQPLLTLIVKCQRDYPSGTTTSCYWGSGGGAGGGEGVGVGAWLLEKP